MYYVDGRWDAGFPESGNLSVKKNFGDTWGCHRQWDGVGAL